MMAGSGFGGENHTGRVARPLWTAIKRGFMCRCPKCGEGRLFKSFLKTVDSCERCGEEMHHHRADDLPAYLVVVVVGHIIVGAFMGVEATSTLSTWQHLAIWVPLDDRLGACPAATDQGRCRRAAMGALYAWLRRRRRSYRKPSRGVTHCALSLAPAGDGEI